MKSYVVWEGKQPGIYGTWAECKAQTDGYSGAKFKSFDDAAEAQSAYEAGHAAYLSASTQPGTAPKKSAVSATEKTAHILKAYGSVFRGRENERVIAVDAGCSGNPGKVYYRGVSLPDSGEVFAASGLYGTNNIGEFLAMVHGLRWMKEHGFHGTVYFDSLTAHTWVQKGQAKRHQELDAATHGMTDEAEAWLQKNGVPEKIRLVHWDTKAWGEIPADFGLK